MQKPGIATALSLTSSLLQETTSSPFAQLIVTLAPAVQQRAEREQARKRRNTGECHSGTNLSFSRKHPYTRHLKALSTLIESATRARVA